MADDSEGEVSSIDSLDGAEEQIGGMNITNDPPVTSTTSTSEGHKTVHEKELHHFKCSLKFRGVERDQLRAIIQPILEGLGDSQGLELGLRDALKNLTFRINTSIRPGEHEQRLDRRTPGHIVLEKRLNELKRLVLKRLVQENVILQDDFTPLQIKKMFCQDRCANPCTNNCYSTMINEAYHKQQDKLLDIPQLGLDGCRPEDDGKLWMITKKVWDDISSQDLADLKATKGPKQFKKQFELNDDESKIKGNKKCEASHKEFLDLIYTRLLNSFGANEMRLNQRSKMIWTDSLLHG